LKIGNQGHNFCLDDEQKPFASVAAADVDGDSDSVDGTSIEAYQVLYPIFPVPLKYILYGSGKRLLYPKHS